MDGSNNIPRKKGRPEQIVAASAASSSPRLRCSDDEQRRMTLKAHLAVHEWLGDEIQLWFDPRNLRLFDRDTTENVSLEADRAA
jgi:hypothetical protein